MSSSTDRAAIDQLISMFLDSWESGSWNTHTKLFSDGCELKASHLTDASGALEIIDTLRQDRSRFQFFKLQATNRYIGGVGTEGVFSLYAFGSIRPADAQEHTRFGMTLTGRVVKNEKSWQFTELRIALNWITGATQLVGHWTLPPGDRGWKIGDNAPTIVSELNSPWHICPDSTLQDETLASVVETYARYAWALDQADMSLLADCFTDDAAGDFQPMGIITGRHAIIGSFKEFRRPWPWMQHFGEVIKVSANETEGTAHMIVGRIVPDHAHTDEGMPLYGAHYRMRLRRKRPGFWQITWSEYRPGWFTANDAPEL